MHEDKMQRMASEKQRLASHRVPETSAIAADVERISGQKVPRSSTLEELLRRPHVHYAVLDDHQLGEPNLAAAEREGVEIQIKYAGETFS